MKFSSILAFGTTAFAVAIPDAEPDANAVPQAGTTYPLRFSAIFEKKGPRGDRIDGQIIQASDSRFWIGKYPDIYCPANSVARDACGNSQYNTTYFEYLNGQDKLRLNTKVPGGQDIYVNLDTGALRFTTPHSAQQDGTPKLDGFNIAYNARLQYEENDFYACPDGPEGTYRIFAQSRKRTPDSQWPTRFCVPFTWKIHQLDDKEPTAWQYQ